MVLSSINNCDARGVAVLATAENEATMVLAEKTATVSMLVAMMLSRLPIESDPSLNAMSSGISGPSSLASVTATSAANENSAHRTQVLCSSRCSRQISFSGMRNAAPRNAYRPTMRAGSTQASNSSAVTWPEASAASRRLTPSLCAFLAMKAALS